MRFIYNPDYESGISASIKAGITQAKQDVDGFIIFLGDMPLIDQNMLKTSIQSFYTRPESAIVVPVYKNRHGNPVIFAQKFKSELLKLTGDRGARPVIEKFQDQVIEVQIKNERLLLDIDTFDDYENLKKSN